MSSYYRNNPLARREQRMAEGDRRRKINGTRNYVYNSLTFIGRGKLTPEDHGYAMYLCGLGPNYNELSPHEMAFVGNLFERACRRRRKVINRHPRYERAEVLPGLRLVSLNRAEVRRLDREAGLARRAECKIGK